MTHDADLQAHLRSLENMYRAAPINEFYRPTIEVTESGATIEIDLDPKFFHSAGAVHGSVYFKMLDDAAFFAANALEPDVFVLTKSFTTYLTRPVSTGTLRSVGRVVNQDEGEFVAQAILYDGDGAKVGRGSGVFVRGTLPLTKAAGYGP